MSKRVYGLNALMVNSVSMSDPVWKLFNASSVDDWVESFWFVLIPGQRYVTPCRFEKWMTSSSWEDTRRDHLRRDKVCLFIYFNWFFGDWACRFPYLVALGAPASDMEPASHVPR